MARNETSTTYQWPAGSGLIDHIEIVRSKNGAVAYLHANEDPALHGQRLEVRRKIRAYGWGTLSDYRNNRFVLRVSGIRSNGALITALTEAGYIKGNPTITSHAAEKEKPKGFLDSLRGNSLRYSGIIATIGNALSTASGFARGKEIGQIGQGVAFAVADLPLAFAGGRDDRRQLSDLLRHLKTHYDQNGIPIPDTASILVETSDKGKGFGELLGDYMHRYANQIKCFMEVVAAGFTIYAGKKQGSPDKIKAASIFGPGFLASLLIPEKKIDDEKYAQAGLLGRAWMKIQSNPLTIGGLLGYSNTYFTYKSAISERRRFLRPDKYPTLPNPKTGELVLPTKHYPWDFTIPSVMIGANGLYAISKKAAGGDIRTTAMEQDVYSISAQIINKLPDNKQADAIESTARFLGTRTEIRGNYSEILQELKKTVAIQRQNPWFEPPSTVPQIGQTKTATSDVTPEVAAAETPRAQVSDVTHEHKALAPIPEQKPIAVGA